MTEVKLFNTPEHQCPYLVEQLATTQFVNPDETLDVGLYTYLSQRGFRRSGDFIYRPVCRKCSACRPIRVPVADFQASKSQSRCLKRGNKFALKVVPAQFSEAHYQLYEAYISERHQDGGMYPTNEATFEKFLLSDWSRTFFMEFYDQDKLIACGVFDQLFDGLSAVYCYFNTDYDRFSLGKLAILKQIEQAQAMNLPYLYLGFQIDECQKMNYKTQYQPAEQLIEGQWRKEA